MGNRTNNGKKAETIITELIDPLPQFARESSGDIIFNHYLHRYKFYDISFFNKLRYLTNK